MASEECAVCLIKYVNEEVAVPKVCNHAFCTQCLKRWRDENPICPIDRKKFTLYAVFDNYENYCAHMKRLKSEQLIAEILCRNCLKGNGDPTRRCQECGYVFHEECLDEFACEAKWKFNRGRGKFITHDFCKSFDSKQVPTAAELTMRIPRNVFVIGFSEDSESFDSSDSEDGGAFSISSASDQSTQNANNSSSVMIIPEISFSNEESSSSEEESASSTHSNMEESSQHISFYQHSVTSEEWEPDSTLNNESLSSFETANSSSINEISDLEESSSTNSDQLNASSQSDSNEANGFSGSSSSFQLSDSVGDSSDTSEEDTD